MTNKLALFGGQATITDVPPAYSPIGKEESLAVQKVMESGVLSKFIGCWHEDFLGGPQVRAFEEEAARFFNVKHAITVNSWTSGLIAAVGAIGIEPGNEVIVSPWTMCASATAILHWNAIPVFADIEPETFNLCPESVEKSITEQTKAILAIDIFGHSANMEALKHIAKKHDLKLISDSAQAPGAMVGDKYAGTLADIGGFSLNYHKHIHTGEGGIIVTNSDDYAERLQLIRNHAEAVVKDKGVTNLSNMLGYNFRLGEIECAIGREQLKKLPMLVKQRQKLATILKTQLNGLEGLQLPITQDNHEHAYYVFPLVLDTVHLGISRERICQALEAEGVQGIGQGYINLHLLPMYQEKIAYGSHGFPWSAEFCKREVNYAKGICPVAEELQDSSFIYLAMCMFDYEKQDMLNIASAFKKVWSNLGELQ